MNACCGSLRHDERAPHHDAPSEPAARARSPATLPPPAAGPLTWSTLAIAFLSGLVLTLAGCASPAGIASKAEPVDARSVGVGTRDAEPLAVDWWVGFADPQLTSLIERAVAGSPNLRLAQARIERANAGIAGARASQGVRVDGAVDLTRQRFSENGIYPPPIAGSIRELGNAQLNASWELDLFGRHRAALDAAIGAARAAEADAAASRVLLSVNVARTWVQLARALEQRAVLERTLAQREQVLGLIRQRVQAGLDTTAELRQGEVGVPDARAQLAAVDEQIALARHALAALTAEPPETYASLTPRISTAEPVPMPDEVPASLLGRRADIAAARWRVEAATADVASARAQFWPSINLTAFVGLNAIGFDRLVRGGSEQWGAGPAIRLPILDAGRLRANLRGRAADLDAAVENYNAGVVDAVRDVADQIASSRILQRQAREQAVALVAAEQAYDVAVQRYRAGLAPYITVLNAETSVLAQRRGEVDVRARRLDVQLQLVRALGGGYTTNAVGPLAARVPAAPVATATTLTRNPS